MNIYVKSLAAFIFLSLAAPAPAAAASRLPTIGGGGGEVWRPVRPPKAGATRRITFADPVAPAGVAPRHAGRGGGALAAAWFWDRVDSGLTAADPARLAAVAADLAPELDRLGARIADPARLRAVLSRHGGALAEAAAREGVSPALLLAVIAVESSGREGAVSPKGAQGLMQLMPATARRFGVENALDPAQNIAAGAAYLNVLLAQFDGDALLALAAYNAGENAVLRHGGVPPYAETREYVPRAAAAFLAARALCAAPPAGPRDPCETGTLAAADAPG